MLALQEGDEKWIETDDPSEFFACSECRRVYTLPTVGLKSLPATQGVDPYILGAPMRVFRVPIGCDGLDCRLQLSVLAVLPSNTSDAALQAKKSQWRWADLKGSCGHDIPWPQWE